jgi:DNA-binding NtrC family response regulator
LQALRRRSAHRFRLDLLPAAGPAMHRVVDQARLAAQSRTPTFLVGPPGAGTHWLARAIHHQGITADLTCAAIHAAQLPAGVMAEVLFGPGGLTRQAGVGSIVLREIALLPRDLQARLLDWLRESNAARPRLIACASTLPAEDVKSGQLLEELRCAFPLEIAVPPLQERPSDLPALIEALLQRVAGGLEKNVPALTPEAAAALRDYRWPGNLTELYAVLLSAVQHAQHERIDLADLPAYVRQAVKLEATPGRAAPRQLPLKLLRDQMERRVIGLALQMARGNKSEAARILEMERLSLLSRMKALGLE